LSKEKKAEFDIEKFATLFRNIFLAMGSLVIIAYPVLLLLNIEKYLPLVVILIIVLGVFYLNYKGSSYTKRNAKSSNPLD
jgi:hypothetical protein